MGSALDQPAMIEEMAEGGLFICRPATRTLSRKEIAGIRLLSDLHIGASDLSYRFLQDELREAQAYNDRILINGDVFDAIFPGDRKRFVSGVAHSRIAHRRDQVNAIIDMAMEILSPYADLIDMIGVGNHDTAVEKYHNTDPVLLLIRELERTLPKKSGHQIHYGGYCGFVRYNFQPVTNGDSRAAGQRLFDIFYHHGAGGAAPVTKGMIDANRKQWIIANVRWQGHKHNRWAAQTTLMQCPRDGDRPQILPVWDIFTGSYYETYHGQSQKSVRANGRRSSYAADAGMHPQGKGGARIEVTRDSNDNLVSRVIL